jgi:exodeoxyribonuclease-5
MVELSNEQEAVADAASTFLTRRRVDRQWMCFEGLAGVGKSFVLAELAKRHPNALLCAPTGKAASVLARKSGLVTSTIHSALYNFRGEYVDEDGERYLSFKPKVTDGAWSRKIALIDEVSMVSTDIAMDLLATGCRVVACGDPGQLPPVRGTRFFDRADATLTTIHRQALDSAIIRQAHSVRSTGTYAADGEDFRVTRHVGRDDILAAGVILCWRNATRHALNALVRAHKGLDGPPLKGETVMCLRNEHDIGILNGAQYDLLSDYDPLRHVATLRNERGHVVAIEDCRFETLDSQEDLNEREANPFGFGYCLTTHKSQGSSWANVILVDEYDRVDHRREWVYTALTRAEKQVLVHSTWA